MPPKPQDPSVIEQLVSRLKLADKKADDAVQESSKVLQDLKVLVEDAKKITDAGCTHMEQAIKAVKSIENIWTNVALSQTYDAEKYQQFREKANEAMATAENHFNQVEIAANSVAQNLVFMVEMKTRLESTKEHVSTQLEDANRVLSSIKTPSNAHKSILNKVKMSLDQATAISGKKSGMDKAFETAKQAMEQVRKCAEDTKQAMEEAAVHLQNISSRIERDKKAHEQAAARLASMKSKSPSPSASAASSASSAKPYRLVKQPENCQVKFQLPCAKNVLKFQTKEIISCQPEPQNQRDCQKDVYNPAHHFHHFTQKHDAFPLMETLKDYIQTLTDADLPLAWLYDFKDAFQPQNEDDWYLQFVFGTSSNIYQCNDIIIELLASNNALNEHRKLSHISIHPQFNKYIHYNDGTHVYSACRSAFKAKDTAGPYHYKLDKIYKFGQGSSTPDVMGDNDIDVLRAGDEYAIPHPFIKFEYNEATDEFKTSYQIEGKNAENVTPKIASFHTKVVRWILDKINQQMQASLKTPPLYDQPLYDMHVPIGDLYSKVPPTSKSAASGQSKSPSSKKGGSTRRIMRKHGSKTRKQMRKHGSKTSKLNKKRGRLWFVAVCNCQTNACQPLPDLG